jgi:Ca2+-binding RTX toxin-like protein
MHVDHPVFRPRAALGATLGLALLSLSGEAALAQMQQHTLPLVLPDGMANEGFLRIVNRSDTAGTVTIHGIDDTGERFGPISFELAANATRHFDSEDLEQGDVGDVLSAGLGDGEGDWRLELTTELDIKPLAYIRTSTGFVTSMHDVVQPEYVPGTPGLDDFMRHQVLFFNPGRNSRQVSRLRVINTTGVENVVSITGVDDSGEAAPGGELTLTLSPYQARTITAQQLEDGADFLTGSLGAGTGKWQLTITPQDLTEVDRREMRPIQVMSLLFSSATGNLANLSAAGDGNDSNRGGDGTDWLAGGEGDDVLNPGNNDDHYDAVHGSTGNDTIVYSDSGPTAYQFLGYFDLNAGVRATINGATNAGTVDKGANGTDTIVDIVNPLDAPREPPYGGFGIAGTPFDDHFDLTLEGGQWMEARGFDGDDTFNIRSGLVRVNYRYSPGSVDVDLGARRANDDGYGAVDTFIGRVHEVEGGLADDTLRGSGEDDRLRGGPGDDTLHGGDGGDRLDGGPGDDMLHPGNSDWQLGASDAVTGSTGNDRIVYTESTGERASQSLRYSYSDLGTTGITATIDGVANRGTVDKGANGTDTIVDVENPLDNGGFTIEGTRSDDVFRLTLAEGQFMDARGGAGNDEFNIDLSDGGWVRISYTWPRTLNGIDLALAAGRASDDGFGSVDTFVGAVPEIRGTDLSDVILGSDNDETFIGRAGDDVIDGRGGWDRLRFDRTGVRNVTVDLQAGTATGNWGDNPFTYVIDHLDSQEERLVGTFFSYRISNIERVVGSNGDDVLRGSGRDERLEGRDGDDVLRGRGGDDRLEGGSGDDVFAFGPGHGHDRITDFGSGDVILIEDLGVTKAQVLGATTVVDGDDLRIDLTSFGGGTILLWGDGTPPVLTESDLLL